MVFTIHYDKFHISDSPKNTIKTVKWKEREVKKLSPQDKKLFVLGTIALSIFSLGAYFFYLICSKRGRIELNNLRQGEVVYFAPDIHQEPQPEEKPKTDQKTMKEEESKVSEPTTAVPFEVVPVKAKLEIRSGLPKEFRTWDIESKRSLAYLVDCWFRLTAHPEVITSDYLVKIAPELSLESIQNMMNALNILEQCPSEYPVFEWPKENLPFYLFPGVDRPDPLPTISLVGSRVKEDGLVLEKLNTEQLWTLKGLVERFRACEESLPEKVRLSDLKSIAGEEYWQSLLYAIQCYPDQEGTFLKSSLQRIFQVFDDFIEKPPKLSGSAILSLEILGNRDNRTPNQINLLPTLFVKDKWSIQDLGQFLAVEEGAIALLLVGKGIEPEKELTSADIRTVLANCAAWEINALEEARTQTRSIRWQYQGG